MNNKNDVTCACSYPPSNLPSHVTLHYQVTDYLWVINKYNHNGKFYKSADMFGQVIYTFFFDKSPQMISFT